MKARFLPAIVAMFAVTGFALIVLASHAWDPMAFVMDRPEEVPADQTWGIGYDGQQAYAIAVDPFGAVEELDRPAYRYQRILYPMLARLLALGVSELIPWSMLFINLVAAAATVYLLSQLLVSRGMNPWWSLAPLLTFNYLIGVRMDLNEPLAYALALAGLWSFERKKVACAAVCFAAAGLAREVALAFPVALAAWLLLRRRWQEGLAVIAAGLIPYLAWAGLLRIVLGISPFDTPLARLLLIPFAGMTHLEGIEGRLIVGMWAVVPAGLALLAAGIDVFRRKEALQSPDALLVLVNGAIIAVLPVPTWLDPLAVLRLGVGLVLALYLWLGQVRPSFLRYASAVWMPSLLLAFMIPGFLL